MPRPLCEVKGCWRYTRIHESKKSYRKLCSYHEKVKYGNHIYRQGKVYIDNHKCTNCGYEGICQRHRLNRKKGYTKRNVIVLCGNCHVLVTLGYITFDKKKKKFVKNIS